MAKRTIHTVGALRCILVVLALTSAAGLSPVVQTAGAGSGAQRPARAVEPYPLAGLRARTKATPGRPPPSRPCSGDCFVPVKWRDYEGFLRWTGEDVASFWKDSFRAQGRRFTPGRQLIITPGVRAHTRCPVSVPSIVTDTDGGLFYCDEDRPETVFLPTEYLKALVFEMAFDYKLQDYRLKDFAIAFIVAHEWGHHVQHLNRVRMSSIRLELQADCLAGMWAYSAWDRKLVEPGDIEEAVTIAGYMGDRPNVKPNDPTAHGTSTQRIRWFRRGYDSGSADRCDTRKVPVR